MKVNLVLLLICLKVCTGNDLQLHKPQQCLIDAAKLIVDVISESCDCKRKLDDTGCRVTRPRDCTDLDKGTCPSGVYKIYPEHTSGFEVFCDMDTDGGGWTLFQRRMDGSVDFYRNWQSYKTGFGNLEGEFWLGNEHLCQITTQGNYMLRIDLEDFEHNIRFAKMGHFSVGDESSMYQLTTTGYTGNAGDSISYHNGKKFSTKDKDNDIYSGSCALSYKGGWWYGKCHSSNLNGLYLRGQHKSYANGVNWNKWKGYNYSLKKTSMMIKRKS